jgi:hypothetical protein
MLCETTESVPNKGQRPNLVPMAEKENFRASHQQAQSTDIVGDLQLTVHAASILSQLLRYTTSQAQAQRLVKDVCDPLSA